MVQVKRRDDTRLLSIAMFILMAGSIIPGLFFREPWLWMDEVLSYVFISDPSMAHMNEAIVSSMDANPPLFFDLYWLIGHTISLDPMFLRIVSVLLFAGTMSTFFWYTTRLIGTPITNFVLISLMVYFTYQNFAHATGIRSYALLLPISLWYFITVHRLITKPDSRQLLVLHTLVGILVAFCHNYGLFYLAASGAFFLGLFLWSKQRNYAVILGSYALMGLVWLVVWFPNFTIQADAGKPHSWIPLPTVQSFFYAVGDLIPSLSDRFERRPFFTWLPALRVSLLAGLYFYLVKRRLKAGFQAMQADKAFQFFLLSGFVFLTTIAISLTISLVYTSIFISRYMWPSQLLVMFQLVYMYHHLASQVVDRKQFIPKLARLLPVYGLLLGGVIFYKVWKMQLPFPSQILTYLPQMNAQYPVFVERADYFLPIWFHNQRPKVSFLLNWSNAIRPGNIRNATVDFKVLKAIRSVYNVPGIVDADKFNAASFPHFYVIDEQKVYQIEDYIERGQVKIVREFPIGMEGHRLLECSFQPTLAAQLPPDNHKGRY